MISWGGKDEDLSFLLLLLLVCPLLFRRLFVSDIAEEDPCNGIIHFQFLVDLSPNHLFVMLPCKAMSVGPRVPRAILCHNQGEGRAAATAVADGSKVD